MSRNTLPLYPSNDVYNVEHDWLRLRHCTNLTLYRSLSHVNLFCIKSRLCEVHVLIFYEILLLILFRFLNNLENLKGVLGLRHSLVMSPDIVSRSSYSV